MPLPRPSRITQRDIAELAGVSQATVSLVLNGALRRRAASRRRPAQRVLEVIRETSYVADPPRAAWPGSDNNLLGIFTYEPAFPSESSDFYTPLLIGIEQ